MNKRIGRMPKQNVEKVWTRAHSMCEGACGRSGNDVHHRRYKSRGGAHNIANLVLLCGRGNVDGCHGRAHSGSSPYGWAISGHDSRQECEVVFIDDSGRGWLFDDSGGKQEVDVTPY